MTFESIYRCSNPYVKAESSANWKHYKLSAVVPLDSEQCSWQPAVAVTQTPQSTQRFYQSDSMTVKQSTVHKKQNGHSLQHRLLKNSDKTFSTGLWNVQVN